MAAIKLNLSSEFTAAVATPVGDGAELIAW